MAYEQDLQTLQLQQERGRVETAVRTVQALWEKGGADEGTSEFFLAHLTVRAQQIGFQVAALTPPVQARAREQRWAGIALC